MILRYIMHCGLVILIICLSEVAFAADPNEFLAGGYTESDTGLHLPYRLFVPLGYDPSHNYPLVLFLHGAGERGVDNELQVNSNINHLLTHVKMQEYSSFLLAPQTPPNTNWASWGETPSDSIRMTLSVINQLENEFSIDPNRLYITGLSLGGAGTWNTIRHYRGRFAAAVPICGVTDVSQAPLLVNQAIWAFHGDSDTTISVEFSREMIAALRAAGGDPLYTEYRGVGHASWNWAYNEPLLYEWMFNQAIPEPSTLILFCMGSGGLCAYVRRRRY